jgi:hypothetical protein
VAKVTATGGVAPGGVGTTQIADASVTEAKLLIADNTTGNLSITAHGFAPKAPNDVTKALIGDGTWGAPVAAGNGVSVAGKTVSIAALTSANVVGGDLVVLRTADSAARNSGNTGTTLTNDDAAGGTLQWAITNSATETYFMQAFLLFNSANATMDVKLGWNATGLPTGATALWGSQPGGAAGVGGYGSGGTGISPVTMIPIGSTQAFGSGAAVTFGIYLAGVFFGGGNAGNITFAWAQNTADAGNLILKAGSFLSVMQLRG